MISLPLVYADLRQKMFYRPTGAVMVGQFIRDAHALAAQLGTHDPIVNICQDRYRFMVGFAATILAGKTNLLPSTYTEETLRQIFADAPHALCLHDHDDWPFPYAHFGYQEYPRDLPLAETLPQVAAAHVVARVFTSGSTGLPVPHVKSWDKLVQNIQAGARQLGLDAQPMSLVGTVPPQHMFGFESTVLLCLIGRCPLWSGKPFYPADIVAALDAMPEPRMLVTTPFHLQALLDADIPIPKIDRLLLATAPLSLELAARAEATTGALLFEIYGSTETGQIATRRPTQSATWTLFPGIQLTPAPASLDDALFIAAGGHIEVPVMLSDRVQIAPDGRFYLLGRVADQVNMAGKRSSLNYLTAQLKAIDDVADGVFFLPKAAHTQRTITRLCALVIAPNRTGAEIMAALRERLDPVFLPRPLIRVDTLPYNATGKLPQMALQAVFDRHLAATAPKTQTTWHIPAAHPVFAGHFPGHPLVPGALLLDWVVERVATHWRVSPAGLRIEQAKFLRPVLPDAQVSLDLSADTDRCAFSVRVADGVAVTGVVNRPKGIEG
ncbi:MAG: hypothetical protein B7Z82_00395 [Halothiobacillus sp. 20-54-6]|nr:MAG: hypothetical protein B7Z82_00395 [Halothiobacillus sp. 20-54-6]